MGEVVWQRKEGGEVTKPCEGTRDGTRRQIPSGVQMALRVIGM